MTIDPSICSATLFFDNSTDSSERRQTWLAEFTNGSILELKTDLLPAWFKRHVLDKMDWQRWQSPEAQP